jgi:ABC-type glycerol-3-phosphate transport system substrate-binding protein
MHYDVPNLYNNLLEHYVAIPATAPGSAFAIGKQYDFQFIYEQSVITMPGLTLADPPVDVKGSRVAWGLTIMNSAPNRENAIKFLQLLFKPGDVGQSTLQKVGPTPISPPVVSADDYGQLPAELQALTRNGDPLAV